MQATTHFGAAFAAAFGVSDGTGALELAFDLPGSDDGRAGELASDFCRLESGSFLGSGSYNSSG